MGRRGLGRGLSALIATGESLGGLRFEEIPVSAIRPNVNQPRRSFSEAGIKELSASIRAVGILQPLVIRPAESGFEIIAGERRLRAAKEAGLERVPVLIRHAEESESMELALVENLQRENLNPLETAAAYQALIDGFGLSREQLALRMGKSRAAVTNTLRLAQLPGSVQELLRDGKLTEGHARALLSLEDEGRMLQVARRIQDEKLSVRKTEELVRQQLSDPSHEQRPVTEQPEEEAGPNKFDEAAGMLQEALTLPVKVRSLRRGGKIEIRFREESQLEAIMDLLAAKE